MLRNITEFTEQGLTNPIIFRKAILKYALNINTYAKKGVK